MQVSVQNSSLTPCISVCLAYFNSLVELDSLEYLSLIIIRASQSIQVSSFSCYYRPERSWAKVIFLHLSVILLTEGVYLVWSRGVYLVWSRGCTWSGPGGGYLVWSWGVYLADTPNQVLPQTRYLPGTRPGTPPGLSTLPRD